MSVPARLVAYTKAHHPITELKIPTTWLYCTTLSAPGLPGGWERFRVGKPYSDK